MMAPFTDIILLQLVEERENEGERDCMSVAEVAERVRQDRHKKVFVFVCV